ncbi:MAG: hypothetical protein B6I34_09665 [Anaerolineaceae bacterium 4572_32.1]|nr:MAG: hypothetical protein B6I34_09665 [Anaerolineaceae bacterium 4572_32.1]
MSKETRTLCANLFFSTLILAMVGLTGHSCITMPSTAAVLPTATPTELPPVKQLMDSPSYGMQIFPWWRPEVSDRDMGLVKGAGFGWIKVNFGWRDIEGAGKGHLDWTVPDRIVEQAQNYGLKMVVRVDHQPVWAGTAHNGPPENYEDYGDLLEAMALRYRGRIQAYAIWNEPNLAREWGGRPPNAVEYVELLKTAYRRIKKVDPEAIVISAGLTPTTQWNDAAVPDTVFLQQMYDAGAASYFDVLGVHGAGFKAPPETDPALVAADPTFHNGDPSPPERKRVYCFRHVEDMRQVMVQNGDAAKQVALLEFGWTSDPRPDSPYNWHAVSEEKKADYFVRAYQYAKEHWQPWIGLMSLIYIVDIEWTPENEQYWWAITEPGYPLSPLRPAYLRLKEMPK